MYIYDEKKGQNLKVDKLQQQNDIRFNQFIKCTAMSNKLLGKFTPFVKYNVERKPTILLKNAYFKSNLLSKNLLGELSAICQQCN